MPSPSLLKVHRVRLPLVSRFTTAIRSAVELETVLVEVMDSDGRSGWGEAPVSRVTRVTSDQVASSIEERLWPLVRGSDLTDPAAVLERLEASPEPAAARMAVDCALHDLAAQQQDQPLAGYLGSALEEVATDMTLSIAGPEELARTAAAHVRRGFGSLKIKLGAHGDALAAMKAVRAAVGPDVTLRIDANQAFQAADAVRLIRSLEDAGLGIELVEQPVAAGDWAGLAQVSAAVVTPVMADESVWTLDDLHTLLRHKAAPMVNIKLAKTGGLHHARRMVATAVQEGIGVVIGCMLESHVGIAAAASLAATVARQRDQDLDGGLWLASSPVSGGARYSGNAIALAAGPGLGITGLEARQPARS